MKSNFCRLIILSVGFLLLGCVFFTAQSLAAKVLNNLGFGYLGYFSLTVLYLVYAFSSLIATPIVIKCGERLSLTLGSLCHAVYIGSFMLASASIKYPQANVDKSTIEAVIYLASVICGFGASILWVGQGRYISRIANDENKGTYNSIFLACFQSSQIIMLINAVVLSNTDTFTFYCVMTGMCVLSSLFFLLLPSVEPDPDEPVEVFSFKYDIRDTCMMLINKRMVTLFPTFIT